MSQNCTRSHERKGSLTLPYPAWHGYACSPISDVAWHKWGKGKKQVAVLWCAKGWGFQDLGNVKPVSF